MNSFKVETTVTRRFGKIQTRLNYDSKLTWNDLKSFGVAHVWRNSNVTFLVQVLKFSQRMFCSQRLWSSKSANRLQKPSRSFKCTCRLTSLMRKYNQLTIINKCHKVHCKLRSRRPKILIKSYQDKIRQATHWKSAVTPHEQQNWLLCLTAQYMQTVKLRSVNYVKTKNNKASFQIQTSPPLSFSSSHGRV